MSFGFTVRTEVAMPKIDLASLELREGSIYPAQFVDHVAGRSSHRIGDAGGLTQFGVNIVYLEPGGRSSMRHWHEQQDEFLMVLSGTCTLIEDDGPTELLPGDCAAFPAGVPNGHTVENHTKAPASFLVVGTRTETEVGHYPDHGLRVDIDRDEVRYSRKNGEPL